MLRQGARTIRFCGEEIEFESIKRLLWVIRDQDGRVPKLSVQAIAEGWKKRAELFIYLVARLDFKHDERRMPGEEIPTPGQNAFFLTFRVDFDEIRRWPAPRCVFAIEACNANCFARTILPECVELARSSKYKPPDALAVGKRQWQYMQVGRGVEFTAMFQHGTGFAAWLVGENLSLGADQPRHRQAVNSEICADVDDRHPGP